MYRALLICNSTYPEDRAGLPELNGPRTDGFVLWRALTDSEVGMFLDEDVEIVSERTSTEVLTSAARFFDSMTSDDVALFYFSGHASGFAKDELILCARNTYSHSPSALLSSGVPSGSLSKIIERSEAEAVIVILDCCFSGSFKGAGTGQVFSDLKGTGRYVLAASSALEPAADSHRGQPSPFTRAIVRGLMSAAGSPDNPTDNQVDLDVLFSFVDRDLSQEGPRPWRGYDGSGTVVIARSHKPRHGTDLPSKHSPGVVAETSSHQSQRSIADGLQSGSSRAWLPARRVAGDFTIADLRIWAIMSFLGLAAATCLIFAYYRWPAIYHYNYHTNGAFYTRDKHSSLALLLLIPALSIAICSIIEGALFLRRSRRGRSRREILQSTGAPSLRVLRHIRAGSSYIAAAAILATLFGFEDYSTYWIAALTFIATSAVVSAIASLSQGDALYLAGTLIYAGAAFLPSTVNDGNVVLGINGTPGIMEVLWGIVLVGLWWLRAPRGILVLATTIGLLPILSDFTRSSNTNEGPYVGLIALAVAFSAWALGAGQSIDLSHNATANSS